MRSYTRTGMSRFTVSLSRKSSEPGIVGVPPIADVRRRRMFDHMDVKTERRLSARIVSGLRRAGIEAKNIQITDYSEMFFGNHIANVETEHGRIRVVFDRRYEIDLLASDIPTKRVTELEHALNEGP